MMILSLFERENMEERSSPISYGSQMRYYENLFNEMLSQRTDLIQYTLEVISKLDRVNRESKRASADTWGPAWGTNWDPFWGI